MSVALPFNSLTNTKNNPNRRETNEALSGCKLNYGNKNPVGICPEFTRDEKLIIIEDI